MISKAFAITATLSLLSLTACSHMNGQFDCPVGKGVSCKSMKEIDNMVNQGYFKDSDSVSDLRKAPSFKIQNTLSHQAPFKVESRVLKVWFAPFVDSKDNYHQASEVYTVIDKSFWQGNPVHSVDGAWA